jgi:CubicO group peptidase (beta-lactamase class C family)
VNASRQRRVLYREFLFRVVDRELLSSSAKGDASQLLLQVLTLLLCVGVLASAPALFFAPGPSPQVWLLFSWNVVHFLIAATMLVVGVFGVLGWHSIFPDQRDILVLAPLPVRAHTILLAKVAALATAVAAILLSLHVVTSVAWTLRLNVSSPPYPIPSLTSEPAMPPLEADDLQAVLDEDLAVARLTGALAPGRGTGVSIGVSTRGTRRVFAYGAASPDTLFHLASVTKVFTGLALARLIEQGVVQAGEPVRALIPDARLVAPAGRNEITLQDLVTHHSGLPEMPANYRPRDPGNPLAGFDVGQLYTFLSARGTGRPRAPDFRYSNLGFGLLGHALVTRTATDYETMIRDLVSNPLAMNDTGIVLTADQERRLLPGYDRGYQPVRIPDIPEVLAGAGALKSSAADLLTFLEANLHPERLPDNALSRAIARSHQVMEKAGDGAAGIAFGWGLTPEGDFAHAGGMAGVSSVIVFNPSRDSAFVVLANTSPHTSVSANLVAEHIRARLNGTPPLALTDITIPAQPGGVGGWLRLFVAYWLTMLAAGLFVFSVIAGLQGIAAALLPHRYFLRTSSVLQLGVFALLVGTFFLQPMAISRATLLQAKGFDSLPSHWFLGLFQTLNGSPALEPLARRAVVALVGALVAAALACALSYMRTLRRLAEEPDMAPAIRAARRLPPAGGRLHNAIVHFSARTLFRSPAQRILYTFYLGIGFALSAVVLKAPRLREAAEDLDIGGWTEASEALIVSSVLMMVCAVVGARLTFAMPRDLPSNWIFRILPMRGGAAYVSARRRALVAVAAGPVWMVSACVFLAQWPWLPAIGHMLVLALVGGILVELSLSGTQRIPFTCSYLPGQSRSNISAPAAVVMLLLLTLVLSDAERRALEDGSRYLAIIGILTLAWAGARWRTQWLANSVPEPEFEDEPTDRAVSLEVWDMRAANPADGGATAPR